MQEFEIVIIHFSVQCEAQIIFIIIPTAGYLVRPNTASKYGSACYNTAQITNKFQNSAFKFFPTSNL